MKKTFYEVVIKRFIDIVLSLVAIIVLSPILLVVAILVRVKLGSPVIFAQPRPGYREKIFTMYKFRTMTDKRDEQGNLLPDSERLTKFGKMLRATSLDELPELFNILKGDISIVGPRPLLVQYLPRYNEKQHHRHDVRPGLTGYAQANGRNAITWEEKFEKDLYYVENISLLMDIKVLIKTVQTVLSHEGINAEGSATMEAFEGDEECADWWNGLKIGDKKDVVIVAQFLGDIDDLSNNNSRFLDMARQLTDYCNVEIVTTTFVHAKKQQAVTRSTVYDGIRITALYEPGYPRNVSLKRFASHKALARNVKYYLKCRKVPDAVYVAIPSIDVAEVCADYAQEKNVQFIIDIQDLWPEAFKMILNPPVIGNLVYGGMERRINRVYEAADNIIAVSKGYCDRALKVNKKCEDAKAIYLGTNLEDFDRARGEEVFLEARDEEAFLEARGEEVFLEARDEEAFLEARDEEVFLEARGEDVFLEERDAVSKNTQNFAAKDSTKTDYENIKNSMVTIAYVGTLGHSYDLGCVFDALEILKERDVTCKFLVMGDGPLEQKYREYAASKNIDVEFTGRLEYSKMIQRLCACDIAVNPITHNAAQSIINKHADYVAAGLPIVSTQENPEFRNLIDDYQMGINCENNNAVQVAEAFEKLIGNKELRENMGLNARRCAEERFDRRNSYSYIREIIK